MAKKPLRVLMVIPAPKKNNVSMVFARRHIDSLEQMNGLIVYRLFLESRTSFLSLIKSLRTFFKVQSEFKPDVVHCHYGSMTAFFSAIAAKAPLVITFRGSDLNPVSGNGRLHIFVSHLLSQLASLRARYVICVSEQLKSRLWWPCVRSRTIIIPTPVDLEIFKIMDKKKARELLGWMQEDNVILFNNGNGSSNKRLDLAKEAVKIAKKYIGNKVRFVVLDGNIPPEKIPILMNGADCLLVTSDYEGSPNVVKEAMACNLPVVSVNVGDVLERLHDVYPSRIVDRDPLALGKAIVDILNQKCRSNGRIIAEHDISTGIINKKTVNVYLKSINRTGDL